ncbi:MAG TPA: 2Fe-2S iron-sulfur cluster binding domain-containing protein, partial [Planctomycetaceae bacterium]|nr:2Fe-2S iron-sulfur cluster binding domain-containing protein [Planctomycetaceae bacterium]
MNVTIDGQTIDVEPGTTILQAARRLGIEIPTLCYVEGFEPVSACFLCAVQIEGRPNLSPACSMPVSDGMVVDASGDEVRAARRMALELLLSDHAGDCVAPCHAACPAGLDIAGFAFPIAAGRPRDAMPIIAERLALPRALGQVCPRLCEEHCRRGGLDESVSIAALHRFAAHIDLAAETPYVPPKQPTTGRSVAIIGAGPAGLAAA